ncbi:hypothetical protein [Rhizobium sp. BK602]|uniref:hypothetical protein n=1 Tax=Rhizobium sp. BK602 TaxID=2586986 RepID=UPI00161AC22E|nr:hypothetical protein [Rhizobium sp. BK602]MBB3612663.1 hypothetical protein [Rhizobium sp. BK602]
MKWNKKTGNEGLERRYLGVAFAALCILVPSMTFSSNATASEVDQTKTKTIQLYMKKYERNKVVFYSGNSLARTTKISSKEYFKGAPYICTPSGFGRTSHCYNRGFF